MTFPTSGVESERLEELGEYRILDTPAEDSFDQLTATVARLFAVPVAAVTLVDAERQWFKSICGLQLKQTHRDVSFCAYAMWNEDVMVVPDALLDARFSDNPLVIGEPHIRFYAGAPLRTPRGRPLGALCIIDYKPRRFTQAERLMLTEMAALVADELLLRRAANELRTEGLRRQLSAPGTTGVRPSRPANLRNREEPLLSPAPARRGKFARGSDTVESYAERPLSRFHQIVDASENAFLVYSEDGTFWNVNAAACELFGYEADEFLSLNLADLDLGSDPAQGQQRWRNMRVADSITLEGFHRRKDGSVFLAEARVNSVETEEGRVLLAMMRDISERRQIETLLQVRARQQRAVAELGMKALKSEKVDALFNEAVTIIGDTLEIELCRVFEHLPEQGLITRAGLNLTADQRGKIAAVLTPEYAAGHVMRTGEPVIVRDVLNDGRFKPTPWLQAEGAVSGLHVPIDGGGNHLPRFGLLAAYTRARRVFTEDDVYFVQSVANVLAAAITRERNEDALRAVEARYQRIAAHTPGVVYQYVMRKDGKVEIPFISQGCHNLFGRDTDEIKARPDIVIESVHPAERAQFLRAVYKAKKWLTPFHWRGRVLLPSGEARWVRFDSRPERLPNGDVICDGIIVDVTAERQREDALRQSEKRFRLANFHAPFPIMLHADDGEVLQVNDAWTHITGYSAESLRTIDDWRERAYPELADRESERAFLDDLTQHVGAVEARGRWIRCASGQMRIWDFRCANLDRLPDGRWLHILTAVDVTEQRGQEAALRQAKEEAERANAAKSTFLSRMSHELRTPLNAILGFGQLLELEARGEDDRQSVDQILKGGRHLIALVDEVLDLARVEAGELDLRLGPVSICDVMHECLSLVERLAAAHEVSCHIEPSCGSIQSVLADEHRLRQILLNLLSNAIKYNRRGGSVAVSCKALADGRVRLKVKDGGYGISREGLANLFIPFQRLGQELTDVEGSGLGLTVSKQLAEAMNGEIGVESEVGAGSVFWIDLPGSTQAARRGPDPIIALPVTGVAPVASPRATLLYIEDNPSNVQVVKMLTARQRPHWRFLTAADGRSGIQMAREVLPTMILLDLQLPEMKGDAVLAELRSEEATRDIPVLVLSADAMSHSRERLLALGAHDYLFKPFNVTDLLDKLDPLSVPRNAPAAVTGVDRM